MMFQRMFGSYTSEKTRIGKFENLQQDFLDIMNGLSVAQASLMNDELSNKERKNTSQHSHYFHYYDAALQKLVAEKETQLIDTFHYQFENIGPSANAKYDHSNHTVQDGSYGFQKLLGRASNYLKLHDNYNVEDIKDALAKVEDAKWRESGREVTQPLVAHIAKYYQDNGFVVCMVFTKLLPGGTIPEHTGTGYSLLNCHRIHIPNVSNKDNLFFVGGEQKIMQVGEFWEINNANLHSVNNQSNDDRIHLIIDWMPNPQGKPLSEAVLPPNYDKAAAARQVDSAQLNLMVRFGCVAKIFHRRCCVECYHQR
jgi:hypothetical protein